MRYFSADHHFGHANIIRFTDRPFASVSEMNERLIRAAWDTLGPDDELICLGDLALGVLADSLEAASRLPGRKTLLVGNHDRPMSEKTEPRRAASVAQYEDAGFTVIRDPWIQTNIGGHEVLLSHFPYTGDSHDGDRYTQYRAVDTGLPMIHGHVHTAWKIRGREFNVGVDMNEFRPVSETTLAAWLDQLR